MFRRKRRNLNLRGESRLNAFEKQNSRRSSSRGKNMDKIDSIAGIVFFASSRQLSTALLLWIIR